MISVIIPTLNAAASLDNLLSSLKNQSVPCEIIVVDSSSLDGTEEIAAAHSVRTIRIRKEEFGHGRTRNLAAGRAQGDIISFFTQDALPLDERCLENLVEPLSRPDVAASYGRQIPTESARMTERFARSFNYSDVSVVKAASDIPVLGIKTFFFSNVCSAVRREEFTEIGGFPEEVVMFEDMLFAARLILKGYKIAYVPGARVSHSHDYNCRQQFRRYLDAGVSFRNNPWFLAYTTGEREGLGFLSAQIGYLLEKRAYLSIPYSLAEAFSKYIGYRLGLHYHRLPGALRRRIVCPGGCSSISGRGSVI
jgi:rhamnosyltransferase